MGVIIADHNPSIDDGSSRAAAAPKANCVRTPEMEEGNDVTIWVRTPEMEEGNEVKLDVPSTKYINDVRCLAMEVLHFDRDAGLPPLKEGELEVLTSTKSEKVGMRKRVRDLTDDTLIIRISASYACEKLQKRPASPPPEAGAKPTAAAEAGSGGAQVANSLPADPLENADSPPSLLPADEEDDEVKLVVYIDRISPHLPDACLRKAVEDKLGRVAALEVVRSGVSEEARSTHAKFAYAFAFLTDPPKGFHTCTIDFSHGNVSSKVTCLGAEPALEWEKEQVRVQVTKRTRSLPKETKPKATLHIRVFAHLTREQGSWSERVESVKWAGLLALLEATHEGARGDRTPTDYIKIIADDRGSTNSSIHAKVLLCGFFVECNSVADAENLMEAVNDQRVCCKGVSFLLQCDYTLKEKKLYDRCGRRDTYKHFYARFQQEYDTARKLAKDAVEGARTSGSLVQLTDEAGGFFAFGGKQGSDAQQLRGGGKVQQESSPKHQQPTIVEVTQAQPSSSGATAADLALALRGPTACGVGASVPGGAVCEPLMKELWVQPVPAVEAARAAPVCFDAEGTVGGWRQPCMVGGMAPPAPYGNPHAQPFQQEMHQMYPQQMRAQPLVASWYPPCHQALVPAGP